MIEHVTTAAERLTGKIRREASTIARGWGHMLPDGPPAQRYRIGSSPPAGIVSDHSKPIRNHRGYDHWRGDHTKDTRSYEIHRSDSDIDPMTRILSLRATTAASLNGWCRAVMEDRPIRSPKALPLGDDVPGMCAFIERHADWIATEAEWAHDCADELEDLAAQVQRIVDPWRKERHHLGWCTFVVGEDFTVTDSDARSCRGRVTLPIGGDQDEASCDECGTKGTLRWWEDVLGLTRREVATIPQLAQILRDRLHIDVTDRTLRNWAKAGRITPIAPPIGPQPQHRRFEVRDVLDEVARWGGQCVMCGTLWEGQGDTCTRCYVTRSHAMPRRAETRRTAGLLP